MLSSEFERDPARGAFPGAALPTTIRSATWRWWRNADLYLIAPASANTIAKLAHGLADNLLSSCALAATCPVVVAPAMNNRMYEHQATQANLRIAARARRGDRRAGRSGDWPRKGEQGVGRLAEPARLLEACEAAARRPPAERWDVRRQLSSWRGLKVLVTAGGTREPIDSVRFVGNSSSGRMGFALARAAARAAPR